MALMLAADRTAEDYLGVTSYFEVHVRRDARWTIDCTATSAPEALAEAEDMARRTDVSALKVVNERYNPRIDRTAARVIYAFEKPQRERLFGPVRLSKDPVDAWARPALAVALPVGPSQPGATAAAGAPLLPTPPPPLSWPSTRSAPTLPAAPWLLFAWASLVLALGATALFVLLLFIS